MASEKEIKNAVNEVKENLVLNNFRDAMMLMAQISIELIEYLVDENLIVSKGYEEDLKVLLNNNIIDSKLERNFETMIISGIQAHNGVDIPKEHAEKALEVLEGMVRVLIDDKSNNMLEKSVADSYKNEKSNKKIYEYNEEDDNENYDENSIKPAFMSNGEDVDFREKERMRQEIISKNLQKPKRRRMNIFTILLPIGFILLIAVFFRSCINGTRESSDIEESELASIVSSIEETSTEETETEPPTTSEAGYYTIIADVLRIRSEASENSTVVALLSRGDQVQVVRFVNDVWALIRYQQRDAFVAIQYIQRNEVQTLAPEYNEE